MSNAAVTTAERTGARETRLRWKEIQRASRQAPSAPPLKIAVLGSYTADPLIPYLGVAVDDIGFRAVPRTGPYNQIVQECLDDQSGTGTFGPDILVISPRFEELWAGRSFPLRPEAGTDSLAVAASDLVEVVEAGLSAAERWDCTLVVVLPAVPDDRLAELAQDNAAAGLTAAASWAREQARARVAGARNAYVVDAEAVLRSVGAARAQHPAMFRHAKIPYTEEVFAALGERIGRTLGLRFGGTCRVAALDLAGIVATADDAEDLVPLLRQLATDGIRTYALGSRQTASLWCELGSAASPVLTLVADWSFTDGPTSEQLRTVARREAVPPASIALISGNPDALAATGGAAGPGKPVALGPDPDRWLAELRASGAFGWLPTPAGPARPASASPGPASSPTAELSLDAFVAQLGAEVEFSTAGEKQVDKISEMMHRTKDFTLGTVLAPERLAAALADEQWDVVVGTVRDRFGDFGVSVMMALHHAGPVCEVEALLLSCPVMGKGIEEKVMRRIVTMAADRGSELVRLPYRTTGRNQVAVDFVEAAQGRDWGDGDSVLPTIEPVLVPD